MAVALHVMNDSLPCFDHLAKRGRAHKDTRSRKENTCGQHVSCPFIKIYRSNKSVVVGGRALSIHYGVLAVELSMVFS